MSLQSPVRLINTHQFHQADANTKIKGTIFTRHPNGNFVQWVLFFHWPHFKIPDTFKHFFLSLGFILSYLNSQIQRLLVIHSAALIKLSIHLIKLGWHIVLNGYIWESHRRISLYKNQTSWEMKIFNPPSNFACS